MRRLTNIKLIETVNESITVAGIEVIRSGIHIVSNDIDFYVDAPFNVTTSNGMIYISKGCCTKLSIRESDIPESFNYIK